MKETDLYDPVRNCLTEQGYAVYAEVKHCDVVAVREDSLVVVELKTSLNLSLLTQAVDRQRVTDEVYLAIPHPRRINKSFRDRESILKRLGLGLITIQESPLRTVATVRFAPDHQGRINTRRRNAVLKEISGRSIDPNQGGSTGVRVYTAYRETAVVLAMLLEASGPSRVGELRPMGGDKTQSILYTNHYGWFERVARGTYALTAEGRSALQEYSDLRALLAHRLSQG